MKFQIKMYANSYWLFNVTFLSLLLYLPMPTSILIISWRIELYNVSKCKARSLSLIISQLFQAFGTSRDRLAACYKYVSEKKNAFEKIFVPLFPSKHNFSSDFLRNLTAVIVSLCFPPNDFWPCLSTSKTSDGGDDDGERGLDFTNMIKIPEISSKSVAGKRKRTLLVVPLKKSVVWDHTSLHTEKVHAGEHHYKLWKKASIGAFCLDRNSVQLKLIENTASLFSSVLRAACQSHLTFSFYNVNNFISTPISLCSQWREITLRNNISHYEWYAQEQWAHKQPDGRQIWQTAGYKLGISELVGEGRKGSLRRKQVQLSRNDCKKRRISEVFAHFYAFCNLTSRDKNPNCLNSVSDLFHMGDDTKFVYSLSWARHVWILTCVISYLLV